MIPLKGDHPVFIGKLLRELVTEPETHFECVACEPVEAAQDDGIGIGRTTRSVVVQSNYDLLRIGDFVEAEDRP
jgi:hypothetical protein